MSWIWSFLDFFRTSHAFWEYAEYFATVVVLVGVVAETLPEFKIPRDESARHRIGRIGAVVLVAGIALELVALVKTNALADKEVADLNQRTATASGRIADSTAAAERARADAANARDGARQLELRIAEQQEKTANAERQLSELQEARKARHLSNDAKARMLASAKVASPKGQVEIECPAGTQEACEYGEEIATVLKAAGWSVQLSIAALTGVKPGILLMQHSPGAPLPHVEALHGVLSRAGIAFTLAFHPRVGEGSALILVGPKN
jgi:hypothetical protein